MALLLPGRGVISPASYGAAPSAGVTFDSASKGTGGTLSNGDLTVTGTSAWAGVRVTSGKSSGSWYAEFKIDAVSGGQNFMFIGLCDNTTSPMDTYMGNFANSASVDMNTWPLAYNSGFTNGTGPAFAAAAAANDIIQIAYDATGKKFWIGKNNTYGGDPGAGTGPAYTWASSWTVFPCLSIYPTTSTVSYVPAASHNYSPPSGFTALS